MSDAIYRQRLDQALTAVGELLMLVRVAKQQGVKFCPHHEELFKRAEALYEDETSGA